ncbi:hypothetical protein ACIA8F_18655 [Streptomyces sp. NPDC051563]|uniref:hypothetical protein n=1 Tax=Streptomyces sp. NPDC051563 TaxID=3365659 RepID=UPI0037A499A6
MRRSRSVLATTVTPEATAGMSSMPATRPARAAPTASTMPARTAFHAVAASGYLGSCHQLPSLRRKTKCLYADPPVMLPSGLLPYSRSRL